MLDDRTTQMAVVEITIPTGHYVSKSNLNKLLGALSDSNSIIKSTGILKYEIEKDQVNIYLDKISSDKTCFEIEMIKDDNFEVENQQKRTVLVYDYYDSRIRRSILVL